VDDEVGRIEPSLLGGRRAEAPDEVVVAAGLGAVGDLLTVVYGDVETELEVVGVAALPGAEAMLTFEGLQQLTPEAARQTALVELEPGADLDGFVERAFSTIGYTGQDIALPDLPDDLVNFGRVDTAPAVIAATMSLVAVATLAHALVTTVQRRRRDLAILRALGLTRRQVLVTVGWQAAVIVLLATVLAVPAGVAAGRWGWILFADELNVISVPIVPVLALLAAAATSMLLAQVAALLAGRWSFHRSTAAALRAE
jgi:predicted lysophospholipase L1 biosynthesis ABC-type transport system permease subunit